MLHEIGKMILRYGAPMVLYQGGEGQQIRAFLQETQSHGTENARREFSALGEVPGGVFVYIGPAVPQAAAGDLLIYQERIFELRRAEPVMVGEKAVYCWGLCVEKGGDGTWSS